MQLEKLQKEIKEELNKKYIEGKENEIYRQIKFKT